MEMEFLVQEDSVDAIARHLEDILKRIKGTKEGPYGISQLNAHDFAPSNGERVSYNPASDTANMSSPSFPDRAAQRGDTPAESGQGKEVRIGLVVDGATLAAIFTHSDLREKFLKVCQSSRAVLCCRMSPLQKGKIVQMVKEGSRSRPITLAVGDGANDVCMIQEAHVGIGVMGKEGRQAVHASDYAIARFHFLKRLLLVHGRFFYLRLALMVNYFFYKNVVFIGPLFIYIFFSAYSAQSLYAQAFLVMYNTVFTSLPVLIYGLFEQDLLPQTLMNSPKLYRDISCNQLLSWKQFFVWFLYGCWHAIVLFFGFYCLFLHDDFDLGGTTEGVWAFGTIIYAGCIIVANLKLGLLTHYWMFMTHVSIWGSIAVFFVFTSIYCVVHDSIITPTNDLYYVLEHVLEQGAAWLTLILVTATALLPDMIIRIVRNTFNPTSTLKEQVREYSLTTGEFEEAVVPSSDSERTPLIKKSRPPVKRYTSTDSML